uniref:AlNc14C106G6231 protein n=1 Tax=Albugo laibachii Nc14 TaxID=890382 RepID=F0WI24_9STRA|nr:AlNc14C106G6231 [Albugo laibachii Nc14]|eukprot:CCA20902.1 AlNc14C106G6231 [Albugo laibachii Nc14]
MTIEQSHPASIHGFNNLPLINEVRRKIWTTSPEYTKASPVRCAQVILVPLLALLPVTDYESYICAASGSLVQKRISLSTNANTFVHHASSQHPRASLLGKALAAYSLRHLDKPPTSHCLKCRRLGFRIAFVSHKTPQFTSAVAHKETYAKAWCIKYHRIVMDG